MKKFFLSWKGAESGPYSAEEIADMLERGKIGLLHLVRTESTQWRPLKDANLQTDFDAPQSASKTDILAPIVYAAAGLAFLSPWVLAASCAMSVFLWISGDRKSAAFSFALAALIACAGLAFFGIVYPAVAE